MAVGFDIPEKTIKESFEYLKHRNEKTEGISFNDLIVILTIQKKKEDVEYALLKAFSVLGFSNLEKVDSEVFLDFLNYKGFR